MEEKDYIVSMVFSNWTLSKIFEFFQDYLDAQPGEIGLTKIERFKDKKSGEFRDSNRTIILLKRTLFKKALDAGLDMPQSNLDFRISEYLLKEKNFPAPGYTSNLYLIIPKNIDHGTAQNCISDKLLSLINFGVLKAEDYSLKIPLISRMTGEHRGFAYLSFTDNVDISTKAIIKSLLNDSFLYIQSIEKLYHLPVFWAKDYIVPIPPLPIRILKREEPI